MTAKEALVAARTLVEAGWTQEAGARTSEGEMCSLQDRRAVSFCAYGALVRTCGPEGGWTDDVVWAFPALGRALALLEKAIGGSITTWNDAPGRTREDVVSAFDRAIALASGKGVKG